MSSGVQVVVSSCELRVWLVRLVMLLRLTSMNLKGAVCTTVWIANATIAGDTPSLDTLVTSFSNKGAVSQCLFAFSNANRIWTLSPKMIGWESKKLKR